MSNVRKVLRSRLFFLLMGALIGSTFSYNHGFGWIHIAMVILLVCWMTWAIDLDDDKDESHGKR